MARTEGEQGKVQGQRRRWGLKILTDGIRKGLTETPLTVVEREALESERRNRLREIPGTRQYFLAGTDLPQDYGLHPSDPHKVRRPDDNVTNTQLKS